MFDFDQIYKFIVENLTSHKPVTVLISTMISVVFSISHL